MVSKITQGDLLEMLLQAGINTGFSVPCSITKEWHQLAVADERFDLQVTTHEHNLPGLAIGHWFGTGKPALIHMQNSGLPNAGDGLISCASPDVYNIPLLSLITWRGHDLSDESEPHQAIGQRTESLIASIFGVSATITGDPLGTNPREAFDAAIEAANHGRQGVYCLSPLALKENKGDRKNLLTCSPDQTIRVSVKVDGWNFDGSCSRDMAIKMILAAHPDAAILFSNGYTSRAAQAIQDSPHHFYNIGYMGGTLAIGYGLARSRPDLEVIVVDGDQNASMSCMKDHLQAMPLPNLFWYILDNGAGSSVGASKSLPLASAYQDMAQVINVDPDSHNAFLHPRVRAEGRNKLDQLATRFRNWIQQS